MSLRQKTFSDEHNKLKDEYEVLEKIRDNINNYMGRGKEETNEEKASTLETIKKYQAEEKKIANQKVIKELER